MPSLSGVIKRCMLGTNVLTGKPSIASGTFLLDTNLMEVPLGFNQTSFEHTCITSSCRASTITSQILVAVKIMLILVKTPNNTAKAKSRLRKRLPN
jgi:hypothetical protein